MKKNLNPTFPNSMKWVFTQEDYISKKLATLTAAPVLRAKISDHGRLHDSSMGYIEVDLSDLISNNGDFTSRTLKVRNAAVLSRKKEKVSGMISFSLTFRPST